MYDIDLSYDTMFFRLLLSVVLGGLIGWERERRNKQAGLKTHLLVSVGSTLIMLTSIYGFDSLLMNHPNARFDPARLSAQVVSGIGFLGAGAILRRSNHVISGLTTAATLWVAAAIGLSVGSGFYWPAVITTGIVLASNLVLNKYESKFLFLKKSGHVKIMMKVAERSAGIDVITSILQKANMAIEQLIVTDHSEEDEWKCLTMEFRVRSYNDKGFDKLFERLWKVEGVKEVRVNWKE